MAGEFDMNRMQEEAARRAREMQARARFPQPSRQRSPQGNGNDHSRDPTPRNGPEQRDRTPEREAPAHREQPISAAPPAIPVQPPETAGLEAASGETANGLLEALFKDKEKTIILALLILLGSEGGNHELMFALMFLLM